MSTTTSDLARAARCFAALSDETRLHIVQRLAGGEQCVCDLQETLGSYQSRLSFHLKKLKDAGLVTDRKEGRWVYYSLDAEALDAISGYLQACCIPGEESTPAAGCCR